ncbi:hypothetical protein BUE80_DR003035, partial [Diplocarpon rosae]
HKSDHRLGRNITPSSSLSSLYSAVPTHLITAATATLLYSTYARLCPSPVRPSPIPAEAPYRQSPRTKKCFKETLANAPPPDHCFEAAAYLHICWRGRA